MVALRAYQEIIDFIVGGTSPQTIIDFKPSEKTKERVANLFQNEKNGSLSSDENLK